MKSPTRHRMRQAWNWLRYEPADWWFLHVSRKPVARALRAARRRLDEEMADRQPPASDTEPPT
ncbi:hypothetical protein [Kitasatospora aureofaciens]|uniref:hypothetical protein n=1 Tax=Kitasatospora aureofaciens TaxID=1894 RepID=UPI001C46F3B6|nr:hypothetical protein [Kitasatospora aureofaciens]MBV6699386.1 hypothetical protein [Kitasatospora aureofaciens]